MEEIANLLRRSIETTASKGQCKPTIHEINDAQAVIAIKYAKENGIWFDDLYEFVSPLLLS